MPVLIISTAPSVGAVLVYYCSSMEFKCWLEADVGIYSERWRGTGLVLPQYGIQMLARSRLQSYAEHWRSTRLVLPQYGVQVLATI